MKKLGLLAVVLAVMLGSTAASADGDFYVIAGGGGVGTKIISLPYAISAPGFYYLGADLSTTGSGITVNTNNVTIDLMGFSVTGNSSPGGIGIDISGRSNVEIRNGTVRSFGQGIYSVMTAKNCRIINMRAISNTGTGIKLLGDNHLVQNCHAANNNGYGIWMSGGGTVITGNVINGNGSNGLQCTAGGNLMGNVCFDNAGYGFSLSLATSDYYVIDRNTVYQNTGGNLNGVPSKAVFGVNAGIP
jgi:hypothetical protein